MKIQPYVEKLQASKEYKDFESKHSDSFLMAGFFILDFETGESLNQIDYYIPSEKKVAAFTLGDKIIVQELKMIDDRVPEELDIRTNIDLEALRGVVEDEMKNRSISEEIKKMIAVIQTIEGKAIWNVNCVLSGMELLKTHVDDESETILKMERSSILDYVKKLPAQSGQKENLELTEEDVEAEMKKLDKIKEQLQKEKIELQKKSPDESLD